MVKHGPRRFCPCPDSLNNWDHQTKADEARFFDWNGIRVHTCFQVAEEQDATKGPASVNRASISVWEQNRYCSPFESPSQKPDGC